MLSKLKICYKSIIFPPEHLWRMIIMNEQGGLRNECFCLRPDTRCIRAWHVGRTFSGRFYSSGEQICVPISSKLTDPERNKIMSLWCQLSFFFFNFVLFRSMQLCLLLSLWLIPEFTANRGLFENS